MPSSFHGARPQTRSYARRGHASTAHDPGAAITPRDARAAESRSTRELSCLEGSIARPLSLFAWKEPPQPELRDGCFATWLSGKGFGRRVAAGCRWAEHPGGWADRPPLGPFQAPAAAIWWLWSFRRLWVAAANRHSERAAARPRRWNRSNLRLNFIWPYTGSIVAIRLR
jgi:hypothetical protein